MDYTKLPNYKSAVAKYTNAVRTGASETAQSQAFDNMINTLETEIMEANTSKLSALMTTQGTTTLTADETMFFNVITSGTVGAEATIPQETLDQVFVELQNAHPLLDIIKFQDAGLRMKAIISDSFASGGTALWGNVFGDITGQLNQAFREVDFSQSKLTAYLAIPKDALNNGYEWLKSFVILQLSEAIGVGLETALVTGDGFEKPIGLMKDLTKGTPALDGSVTYGDKEVFDDWSAITKENIAKTIAPAVEKLSKNENGVTVNLAGKVKLLVNPSDYYSTLAKFMHLTEDGKWVTVLPFGVEIIQSVAVPETKGVLFVSNRYWAYMGGASMQEFDQTLAIEDLQLYTVKSFYYGKAYDNNTALIVTVS